MPAAKSLDEAKFKQQQIYMYGVLTKRVKTNYGEEILCRHHNKLNAQRVLTELRAHYKGSQAAVNKMQQLFKYIVTAKINDFSGSAQKFILHWFEHIPLILPSMTPLPARTILGSQPTPAPSPLVLFHQVTLGVCSPPNTVSI
jgi:hypothetical protein